jgi:hypothetical protein
MRFSIVFDDDDTILAASVDGDDADDSILRPCVSSGYFNISDDSLDAEVPARKEADDGQP